MVYGLWFRSLKIGPSKVLKYEIRVQDLGFRVEDLEL